MSDTAASSPSSPASGVAGGQVSPEAAGASVARLPGDALQPPPGPDGAGPVGAAPVDATAVAREHRLGRRMAMSATQLFLRRIAVQLLSAVSTAVLARTLGLSDFGGYAAGLSTYYLLLAASDFGFSYTLGRELGADRADNGATVRSMVQTQTLWSAGLAVVAVAVAAAAGLGTVRAEVILVLTPAVALSGLSGIRQVFYAAYRTGRLGLIDVVTNGAQAVVVAVVALATHDPVAVAVALSAMIVVNAVAVVVAGRRLIDPGRATGALRRRLLRLALPLGTSSLLATAYFTLDLTVVAFIVDGHQVGYYSAATKALSILVTLPALVVTAALPGISGAAGDTAALGRLLGRLWHWLAAIALPICVGVVVFAPVFVRIFFGGRYDPAIPLVRILAASGIVALVSNVLVTAMIALHRTRWLIVQSATAVVLNVAGNVALVPHFGVIASAWLTLGTELFVVAALALGLRGRVSPRPILAVTTAPTVAAGALVAVGLVLESRPWAGVPAAGLAFLAVLVGLRGWPADLPAPWRRRVATAGN